jgi:hypothetical protein
MRKLFNLNDIPFSAGKLLEHIRESIQGWIALRTEHLHEGLGVPPDRRTQRGKADRRVDEIPQGGPPD